MRGIHWRSQRMRHSETVVAVFLGLDLAEQRFMNLWFHKRVYYVCKIESACVRDAGADREGGGILVCRRSCRSPLPQSAVSLLCM